LDIGKWLSVNGEAIYGTKPWLKDKESQVRLSFPVVVTVKGKDLYLICSQWPDKEFEISNLEIKQSTSVTLLGVTKPVLWKKSKNGILIKPPIVSPSEIRCHFAYVFKIANALKE
jgi:alpha-L-fucosidase